MMAKTAQMRGYEYIAISDHSPGLGIAPGPKTKADVMKKKKEIIKLSPPSRCSPNRNSPPKIKKNTKVSKVMIPVNKLQETIAMITNNEHLLEKVDVELKSFSIFGGCGGMDWGLEKVGILSNWMVEWELGQSLVYKEACTCNFSILEFKINPFFTKSIPFLFSKNVGSVQSPEQPPPRLNCCIIS